MSGKVYLVGAGPGDPGLLTLRGADALGRAQVVVYDRLANPALLDLHVPPGAERIYAGKGSGQQSVSQSQINQLLVQKALEGKTVVRLHGGDPFVFGRGGEEAAALAAAGVRFEVVPGVTSAVAAPAYAGIPVTHREHNTSFAVVTGHDAAAGGEEGISWEKLSTGVGTLVFLMGLENLELIVQRLLQHGRPSSTPVAIIRWGTCPRQETLVGTLSDIVARAAEVGFQPPAVIVVGSVVGLRGTLRWWDNRPLFGKRVLVTRGREQASSLSELLRENGAEPVEVPLLEIVPPESFDDLDAAIARLGSYDRVVFTSANGVRRFLERVWSLDRDVRCLGRARLAAVGAATAGELERRGLRVEVVPDEYRSEQVAAALISLGVEGERILLPRGDIARDLLRIELEKAGATVDAVVCYRTVPARGGASRLRKEFLERGIDVATFASPSAVRHLVEALGEEASALLSTTMVACIGPATADTAGELGLRVDLVATEHTVQGLVRAMVEALSDPSRRTAPR